MTEPTRRARRRGNGGYRHELMRAPIIVVVVAAMAAAVALDRTGPDDDAARATGARGAPAIPAADALSASWYCAEGTGDAAERADATVLLANLGDEEAQAEVTVFDAGEGEGEGSRETVDVPARGEVELPVAELSDASEELSPPSNINGPGIVVEAFGGQVVVEHAVRKGDDVAVSACARDASAEWFFGAGTTVRGTQLMLSLFNPFGDDAIVDLTFLTDTGVQSPEGGEALNVPRRTRITVPIHELLQRQAEIATQVTARTGRVVAEQLLVSDGSEVPAGVALDLGVTAAADAWTFPAGTMAPGRTHTVGVANFSDERTEAEIRTVTGGGDQPEPQTVPIGPRSAAVVDVGALVSAGTEYAVEVRATGAEPVVAEEIVGAGAPADDDDADAADAAESGGLALASGETAAARRWALAGAGLDDAEATIVVFNAGSEPATAELLASASGDLDSPASAPTRAVAAGTRATFVLEEIGVDPDQVLVVQSDRPVYVARLLATESSRSLDDAIPRR